MSQVEPQTCVQSTAILSLCVRACGRQRREPAQRRVCDMVEAGALLVQSNHASKICDQESLAFPPSVSVVATFAATESHRYGRV